MDEQRFNMGKTDQEGKGMSKRNMAALAALALFTAAYMSFWLLHLLEQAKTG